MPEGRERGALERAAADAIALALKEGGSGCAEGRPGRGDVLVFLPGVGEIRAVERLLMVSE